YSPWLAQSQRLAPHLSVRGIAVRCAAMHVKPCFGLNLGHVLLIEVVLNVDGRHAGGVKADLAARRFSVPYIQPIAAFRVDAPTVLPAMPPCLIFHLVDDIAFPLGKLITSPRVAISDEVSPGQEYIWGIAHVSTEPRAKSVKYLLATPAYCSQGLSTLAPRSHGFIDRLLLGRGEDVVGPRAGIGAPYFSLASITDRYLCHFFPPAKKAQHSVSAAMGGEVETLDLQAISDF